MKRVRENGEEVIFVNCRYCGTEPTTENEGGWTKASCKNAECPTRNASYGKDMKEAAKLWNRVMGCE